MGERRAGFRMGQAVAAGLVMAACGAAPKRATVPVEAEAAAPMVLAAPALATVEGYVSAMTGVLDLTADEVCACGEVECSNQVLGLIELRAETAAIGYRLGKMDSPELTAFLALMKREDFQFSDYLEKERPAWYAQFDSRLQICATRIAAASGGGEDEVGEGEEADADADDLRDEDAARGSSAVKASYQPAK